MKSEWLKTVEVATLLGRSDRWVRDRIKDGRLPAVSGGGGQRKSYKINRATVAMMLMAEGGSKEEIEKCLVGVDENFLLQLQEVLEETIQKRQGRYIIVPHGERMKLPVLELEKKHYPDFEITLELFEKIARNPLKMNSTVIDTHTNKAEGHLSLEITSVEFFEKLCRGEVKEEFQPPWEKGQTPILYIDSFILEDPSWAPFLLRDLSRQVKAWGQKAGQTIKACFAVGSAENAVALMRKYGFAEIAKYEGKYPVMLNKDIRTCGLGRYLA